MMFRWTAVRRLAATATLATLATLTACGGGTDRTKAQVRLVNASSGYTSLDLRVDDQLRQGAVTYGQTASYAEVDPGKTASTLSRAGAGTALLSFTPSVSAKKYYTVLAYGPQGALKQVLLDENSAEPDTNRSLLRFVNAAPDAGTLDIYLTGANDSLADSVPVQAGVAPDGISGFLTVASGSYRLRVTAANNKDDLRLDVSGLALSSKQVATLVVSPGVGGVLVKSLLIIQQGSIAAQAATQARLRVAAGLADAGLVSLQVGGSAVLSNVTVPAVTQYVLVPAGTQALVVTVNGTAQPASTQALTAGGDHTLLVYGPAVAPLLTLLTDDNSLPSERTRARIRLVNGAAGLAGAASLSIDFTPVANTVAAGQASAYATLASTSTAQLTVTAAGAAAPLFSAVDQTFQAASTYTVFLRGGTTAPAAIVRRDR